MYKSGRISFVLTPRDLIIKKVIFGDICKTLQLEST